ncbi:MAG TPA: hypothetical protein DCE41_13365 [Cytophagales bacterium]|nr:hypothetical protein [Cytophagales bacterium]HAA22444.1 hypothetical protein [Cytophagales bacterium]HAP59755.1 hypothetical protein [Cytophagales bacterium]
MIDFDYYLKQIDVDNEFTQSLKNEISAQRYRTGITGIIMCVLFLPNTAENFSMAEAFGGLTHWEIYYLEKFAGFCGLIFTINGFILYPAIREYLAVNFMAKMMAISDQQINWKQIPEVRSTIEFACNNLGIDHENIEVYSMLEHSHLPSIQHYNGKVILFLPTNFFVLLNDQVDQAKALLVHEFSHIRQDSNELLLTVSTIRKVTFNLILPVLVVGLLVLLFISLQATWEQTVAISYKSYFGERPSNSYPLNFLANIGVPILGIIILIWSYFTYSSRIRTIRQRSEHLADLAGALAVGDEEMIRVIQNYVEDVKSYYHPSKQERIRFLQSTNKELPPLE